MSILARTGTRANALHAIQYNFYKNDTCSVEARVPLRAREDEKSQMALVRNSFFAPGRPSGAALAVAGSRSMPKLRSRLLRVKPGTRGLLCTSSVAMRVAEETKRDTLGRNVIGITVAWNLQCSGLDNR